MVLSVDAQHLPSPPRLRLLQRATQFFHALAARLDDEDRLLVESLLVGEELSLFRRLRPGDQRHSVAVARSLMGAGREERLLLRAALLHDVGKVDAGMTLFHRVTGVLVEWLSPSLLRRLAAPHAGSWRYPYHVYLYHHELGARMLEERGTPPTIVRLVRGLGSTGRDGQASSDLAALRAADDAN